MVKQCHDSTTKDRVNLHCQIGSFSNDLSYMLHKSINSPSWNYPLSSSLQKRRPLPLQEHPESSLSGSSGDEDSVQESFIEVSSSSQSRSASRGTGIKKKKKKQRKRQSRSQDSDSEPEQRPLAESFHHNRKNLRHEMTKNGSAKAERAAARAAKKVEQEAKQQAEEAAQQENAQLKLELARLQKKIKLDRSGTSARGSGSKGSQSAMAREVKKVAKTKLWKICKFLRNQNKLDKATKYVMETMDLIEFAGLEGKELVEAKEVWIATHSGCVREALNKHRNYVQQELRNVMEKVFLENKEDEFPNEKQILDLAMRDKLDDETPDEEREQHQKLFDNYWNVLMPKVAGHHAWGPAKRHYELMSTGMADPEDKKDVQYVTPSDEAFLILIWLNCYKKWRYVFLTKREATNKDPADPTREPDPDHADMQTPYTDSKSGQKKFGGWLPAGITKYRALDDQIHKNRMDNEMYVEAVEKNALERIQKAEKLEEKEANRKTKKRSKKSADQDDDETDDENDFTDW